MLEVVDDLLHILAVVDFEFDAAVEDAVLTGDGDLMDVDAHL